MEQFTQGEASELVMELTSPAPSEAFSLFKVQPDGSKKEFKLRVRLLREEENMAVLREALAYAKENGELNTEHRDIHKEAQACALIARAVLRPKMEKLPNGTEYYPQLFTSTAQLRTSFTSNEIAACLNAHEVVLAKYRCTEDWRPEELDKWAARLSDTFLGPLALGRLDSAHWPGLMCALAQRVSTLNENLSQAQSTTDDSSGSSPDDSADGTGGSTPSPHVALPDGTTLPEDRLLTKDEADEIARKMRDPNP